MSIRKWIAEHSEEEQQKLVEQQTYLSYDYDKYSEVVFSILAKNGMNVQILNLCSDFFTDGLHIGYKETLPFVRYLGKRMELALNYFKGKTNEEIKRCLEGL